MKLNSKIPILIIVITITIFLTISLSNNDKPSLKTISGDIKQLNDINIKMKSTEESMYFDYEYILNKENIKKQKINKYLYNNLDRVYTDLIEIISGKDLISYIGYEVKDSSNKNEIRLIVDERKNNENNKILLSQGKDKYIYDEDIDKSKINRKKIDINNSVITKDSDARVLGTNRYKDNLYIVSNYYSPFINKPENNLDIAILDNEKNKLESIKTINLISEFKNKYIIVDPYFSYKQKNKIYVLISATDQSEGANAELNDYYLLEYDLDTNKHEINKINIKKNNYLIKASLTDDTLNIILGSRKKGFDLINIDYDINKKKIINKFNVSVEKSIQDINYRYLEDIFIKNEKIYISISGNESYIPWKNGVKIYVLDKQAKENTYKGYLNNDIGYHSIEFEEK